MKTNGNSSQIQCCHCEEMIHPYATRCPYCCKDIIPSAEVPLEKLQNPQMNMLSSALKMDEEGEVLSEERRTSPIFVSQTFYMLLSLTALLAGSCFFFFGILIKLFSHNGMFTLEWHISSWPYFVFSAFVCISFGLVALFRIDK